MSKHVFTWKPDLGAKRSVKPTVEATKFGDGYEQRTARGVNFKPRAWGCTFSRPLNEADAILDFLESRGGLESFEWTDPRGQKGTYVCREWDSSQTMPGVYSVTANFDEVFEF